MQESAEAGWRRLVLDTIDENLKKDMGENGGIEIAPEGLHVYEEQRGRAVPGQCVEQYRHLCSVSRPVILVSSLHKSERLGKVHLQILDLFTRRNRRHVEQGGRNAA